MVNGIADGYFFNFIKKVGDTLDSGEEKSVEYEKSRQEKIKVNLKNQVFKVFIPLTFPYDSPDDKNPIEEFNNKLRNQTFAAVIKGKTWPRPAFFRAFQYLEQDELLDGLFDIPTAMSVLRENVKDAKDP